MRLIKDAGWGRLPGAQAASTPGPNSLRAKVANLAVPLANIDAAIQRLATPGGTDRPPAPSQTAFLIVWSLSGVRNALCDQGTPTPKSTNDQLDTHFKNRNVQAIWKWLQVNYPPLAAAYKAQFDTLDPAADASAFDGERRQRLANLAGFEWLVMATVADPAAGTIAARGRRAAKKAS